MTGYGQSASHLGKPDVGLMTMSEMVMRAGNMVEAAGVPVIADADTGFGNAVNVMRTRPRVREGRRGCHPAGGPGHAQEVRPHGGP